MRDIKFRAWDKATKKMYEVIKIDFYNEKVGYLFADPITQGEVIDYLKLSDIELMQYTGLKDKNGVEIYEGDLFRLEFDDGEYLCSVEFCEEEVGYVSMPKKTFREKYGKLLWVRGNEHFNNNEIIGNIYENPELLEQII